jgi:imidazolonepropionase-like amidohydrolase
MQLVLKGAQLVDGTGNLPIKDATLVIEKDKIQVVGGPEVAYAPDAMVVDLPGCTIVPGFVDAHVHITMPPVGDSAALLRNEPRALTALRSATHAEVTLMSGITTIRDMGGPDGVDLVLRDAIASGMVPGPRILAAGRCVAMTGGHGWFIGREADGPDEVRKAVREQLRAGADVIKLMATGGVMTPGVEPGSPQFTYEELKAGVEEANKAGRRTASHAQGTTGIKNAVLAGITSIEHGIFLNDEVIELMLERGTYLVPTLVAPYWIVQKGRAAGIPDYAVRKTEAVIDAHMASFRKALAAGIRIAFGTDAGTPFNEHGANTFELQLMVENGMSPMQALETATRSSAELLGISDKVGTLEPGKIADVVVLSGDPLADITAVRNVKGVIKEGKIVKGL